VKTFRFNVDKSISFGSVTGRPRPVLLLGSNCNCD